MSDIHVVLWNIFGKQVELSFSSVIHAFGYCEHHTDEMPFLGECVEISAVQCNLMLSLFVRSQG